MTDVASTLPGAGRAGQVHLTREGALARVVLDNPGARNALTSVMYDQLRDICLELAADSSLRMVVVRGAGGVFAAGTDVADLVAIRAGADGVAYEGEITRVLDAVRGLPVPVVALVEGPAVGGGLAIVVCCDLVYATPDARFGAPVARTLGNCVSPATTARIRAAMGRGARDRAAAHRAVGDRGGGAFRRTGPCDRRARGARRGGFRPAPARVGLRPAVRRRSQGAGRRLDDQAGAVDHDDVYARVYGSADFAEGVRAFLEHRPPQWRGE